MSLFGKSNPKGVKTYVGQVKLSSKDESDSSSGKGTVIYDDSPVKSSSPYLATNPYDHYKQQAKIPSKFNEQLPHPEGYRREGQGTVQANRIQSREPKRGLLGYLYDKSGIARRLEERRVRNQNAEIAASTDERGRQTLRGAYYNTRDKIKNYVKVKGVAGAKWSASQGYGLAKRAGERKLAEMRRNRDYRQELERQARDYAIRTKVENRVNASPTYEQNVRMEARKHALASTVTQKEYDRFSREQGYISPWERSKRIAFRSDQSAYKRARRTTSDTGYAPQNHVGGIRGYQNAVNRAKAYISKSKPISAKGSHGKGGYQSALNRAKNWIRTSKPIRKTYGCSFVRSGYRDAMARARAVIKH